MKMDKVVNAWLFEFDLTAGCRPRKARGCPGSRWGVSSMGDKQRARGDPQHYILPQRQQETVTQLFECDSTTGCCPGKARECPGSKWEELSMGDKQGATRDPQRHILPQSNEKEQQERTARGQSTV
jgi:hypothetical protein